jgi:hypothetical protein
MDKLKLLALSSLTLALTLTHSLSHLACTRRHAYKKENIIKLKCRRVWLVVGMNRPM